MTDPLPLLKNLVAIPSVNPMGRDVSGPEFFEGRVTEYLVAHLARLGVPHEVVETTPGRANVIARLDVVGATKTILLDAPGTVMLFYSSLPGLYVVIAALIVLFFIS